jgi:hypothetical protein
VDPATKSVIWRSKPLVSNNVFLVRGRYLVTGYGFTGEPDALFVVRRSDGSVVDKLQTATAHVGMNEDADGTLVVPLHGGATLRLRAEGFDGDRPKLARVAPAPGP